MRPGELLAGSNPSPQGALVDAIRKVAAFDLRADGVRVVASVPGRHENEQRDLWGHRKLQRLLSACEGESADEVIMQASSISSMGPDEKWLKTNLAPALKTVKPGATSNSKLSAVYPTAQEVCTSQHGYAGGGHMPHDRKMAEKHAMLRRIVCRWGVHTNTGAAAAADPEGWCGASTYMPHIKTYVRWNKGTKRLRWALLTSSNFSQAAWGLEQQNGAQLYIKSFEIGVLFTNTNLVPAQYAGSAALRDGAVPLPIPYNLPLTKYADDDEMWCWNKTYTQLDARGKSGLPDCRG